MNELMKSESGIRGIFGRGINPENVMRFAAQFGMMQKRHLSPHSIEEGRAEFKNNKLKLTIDRLLNKNY